ncbi:SAP domain protein [Ancylostoma duodenale]|uniref:SAP domain protein n=1 Tax=Ancylostoma duodenale TaxID=51022 RepID=A0A0C2DAK5_9BILA|nr:SAP domain protein [Ancylostoma duodenale]
MSSRPRRSCARGDTSVLSPSTIFLWSDTRLRQELTRRGLSRVGIRQDLIDRLLDSINGKITEEPSVSSESALDTSQDQGSSQEAVETPTTAPTEAAAGSSTKRKGKRSAPVRSDSAPQPSKKKSKTSTVKQEPESPTHANETPARSTSSDEDSPSPAKVKILSKRSSVGVLSSRRRESIGDNATTQGQALHSRKMSQQKDEEERHHVKRHSVTNSSSKTERISTHKPITEAWAERLAQLKKTNPTKFAAAATTSKEKQKDREDRDEKQKDREIRKKSVPSSTSTELKKPSAAATSAAGNGLDLLDSIMSQQSVFLQTMRKSEDRNSPEIIREVRRSEPTGEAVENPCLEKLQVGEERHLFERRRRVMYALFFTFVVAPLLIFLIIMLTMGF